MKAVLACRIVTRTVRTFFEAIYILLIVLKMESRYTDLYKIVGNWYKLLEISLYTKFPLKPQTSTML